MAQEIVEITFDPKTGNPKIEAIGFIGTSCTAATKPYEDALGGVVEMTEKPEFYELDLNPTTNRQNLQH